MSVFQQPLSFQMNRQHYSSSTVHFFTDHFVFAHQHSNYCIRVLYYCSSSNGCITIRVYSMFFIKLLLYYYKNLILHIKQLLYHYNSLMISFIRHLLYYDTIVILFFIKQLVYDYKKLRFSIERLLYYCIVRKISYYFFIKKLLYYHQNLVLLFHRKYQARIVLS